MYARVCLKKLEFLRFRTTQNCNFYTSRHVVMRVKTSVTVFAASFSVCAQKTPRLRARQRKNAQHASLAHAVGDCTAYH